MEPFESEHPTISIVSAVGRDSAKSDALELRRQIDSVLSQEYPNFEHIVIDGASQDATRDVLRSHPHVLWTSEPHLSLAGQWNAGFERSTGEIVVFVEGEDVFPPAVFSEVYRLLKESHWVMGGKSFRNPSDADEECSSNLFRSYFDVLKYWVFRATPDFSSMFFRRDFLTSLVEGSLFSESYALSAEYELAMRIFRWCEDHRESLPAISSSPLSSGKPALEVNKAKYLEASRVFHREGYRGCGAERRVSIVIATEGVTPAFEKTLQSCSKQSLADLEIITWGVNASPTACVELDRFVRDIALIANDGRYRAVLPSGPEPHSYFDELRYLASQVRSPLVLLVVAGQELGDQSVLEVSNSFEQDSLGLGLLCGSDRELAQGLLSDKDGNSLFNVQSLFQLQPLPRSAMFRTVALKEVLTLPLSSDFDVALREFYLLFQYKAWSIQVIDQGLTSNIDSSMISAPSREELAPEFLQAKLIDRIASVRAMDPFAPERSKSGLIIEFPGETVAAAREFLSKHH